MADGDYNVLAYINASLASNLAVFAMYCLLVYLYRLYFVLNQQIHQQKIQVAMYGVQI
jgi:hypothetical protein